VVLAIEGGHAARVARVPCLGEHLKQLANPVLRAFPASSPMATGYLKLMSPFRLAAMKFDMKEEFPHRDIAELS
jgi:hypothetical protein